MHTTFPTLADAVWQTDRRTLRNLTFAVVGSVLLTLSAKVQIPFYPVPFTMQTFVVLVIGITFGARLAAASVLLYLAQGALGLPVFAGGGGFAYFTGPTAGFLLAFPVAAAALGALAERGWARTFTSTIAAMLIGSVIIFGSGLAWLTILFGWQTALAAGLLPFVLSEAVKILLAALVLPAAWRGVRN